MKMGIISTWTWMFIFQYLSFPSDEKCIVFVYSHDFPSEPSNEDFFIKFILVIYTCIYHQRQWQLISSLPQKPSRKKRRYYKELICWIKFCLEVEFFQPWGSLMGLKIFRLGTLSSMLLWMISGQKFLSWKNPSISGELKMC